jgi:pimeloyl-ACP methyl ester carboxylesterase
MSNQEIRPFRVDVPQADIDDVLDRLARARWTDEIEGAGSAYGVPLDRVRQLAEHWRTRFDWRSVEARLNAHPQYTTTIDGQQVHFLHVRTGREGATPLILTHGWPGSVLEYLDVIEPLTAAGFDLVIPSMPGYGFSGPTTETGWDNVRIARAWVELMRRLGYERYGAMGNDAGSMISPEVGRLDPEHCIGVHVTQLFSFPSGDPAEMQDLTTEEQGALAALSSFWDTMGAFNVLQSQQPQTLAPALADSPVGLLAWNSQLMLDQDDDFIVGNVATYWFTRTTGSSLRLYRENHLAEHRPEGPTTVPTALSAWENDFQSIRRFAERDHSDIRSWQIRSGGSHYAAHNDPDVLVGDVVDFYASL